MSVFNNSAFSESIPGTMLFFSEMIASLTSDSIGGSVLLQLFV